MKPKASADSLIEDVSAGRADLVSTLWTDSPTLARLQEAVGRYASQVHSNPLPATTGLFLNTRLAPFNRLEVRRAINYALDRAAAVQRDGGSALAAPTCQVLPPGLPGYRPYCPYTDAPTPSGRWKGPDLARAQALVARSGTRGMKVTVWVDNYTEAVGPSVAKALRTLGYRTAVKVVQNGKSFIYFGVVGDSRNKVQVGIWAWAADYPAASDFFDLLTCASFVPNSRDNQNSAGFCDRAIDREIKQALVTELSDPQAADQLWQRVDRAVVDEAPLVPLDNAKAVDVVSKRVGVYLYSGRGFGVLIDQLWVRSMEFPATLLTPAWTWLHATSLRVAVRACVCRR
jgi:peptide/nickel transport system substrate-binding protein